MSTAPANLEYASPAPNRYEWELENERARMLRRRFLWFTGTLIVLTLIGAPFTIHTTITRTGSDYWFGVTGLVSTVVQLVVLGLAFRYARAQVRHERRIYALSFWIVLGLGLLSLVTGAISHQLMRQADSTLVRAGVDERRAARERVAERLTAQSPDVGEAVEQAAVVASPETAGPALANEAVGDAVGEIAGGGSSPEPAPAERSGRPMPDWAYQTISLWSLWSSLFITHFVACLFLPWTVREAWRPAGWLLAAAGLLVLLTLAAGQGSLWYFLGAGIALPIAPLPGLGWCWWRYSRFRETYRWKFDSGQLQAIQEDLSGARKIHEASLPNRHRLGPIRMSYVYEPMSQIGGDLLFVHPPLPADDPDHVPERYTVVLLDVTGHGIAAALTVNRLVGELERLFAEHPDVPCDELMASVNRYIYLTMAKHSVFVTGVAICVECCAPEGRDQFDVWSDPHRVSFASAGHPTAWLRRTDGRMTPLESNAMMLGVLPPEAFEVEVQRVTLDPGDAIVAYTDGATEAKGQAPQMLGIEGVRRLVDRVARNRTIAGDSGESGDATTAVRPREAEAFGWPDKLIRHVAAHRAAPPEDDTLIAVVYRPLASDAPPRVAELADEPVADAELAGVA